MKGKAKSVAHPRPILDEDNGIEATDFATRRSIGSSGG
jgi:hypothetical protein